MEEAPSLLARPGSPFGPLVGRAWLVNNLTAPDLQVIDCRWLYDHDRGTATSGRAGVCRGSRVVLYDDRSGFSVAWLWWLLRYHRLDSVALLDGGLPAWRGPLERGVAPRREAT